MPRIRDELDNAVAAGRFSQDDLDAELAGIDLEATDHEQGSRISAGRVRKREVQDTLRQRFGIPANKRDYCSRPRDLAELVDVVQQAITEDRSVRMVGAARAHSAASDPRGGLTVSSDRLRTIRGGLGKDVPGLQLRAGVDLDRLVRVESGTAVRRLLWTLKRQGRALTNHGSGDFQSVGGAIATATHGTAHWCPSLAGLVRALIVVRVEKTAGGLVRPRVELIQRSANAAGQKPVYRAPTGGSWRSRDGVRIHPVFDDDVFDAHVVGLGCLGLVYSVTLDVIPMIHLREWREPTRLRDVLDRIPDLLDTHRHIELVVDPYPRTGPGGLAERKQVADAFDFDALRCQLIRRKKAAGPASGVRPTPMDVGSLPASAGIVGSRIRKVIRDPPKVGPQAGHSMVSCTSITGAGIVDQLPELLLLNLKYSGLGAEWAVPADRLEGALRAILETGWQQYIAFRDDGTWRGQSAAATDRLVHLLERHTPFYNGPSVRWVQGESALLAGTHRVRGDETGVPVWTCIEVGFLGAPKLEAELVARKRHFGFAPDASVPDTQVSKLFARLRKRSSVRKDDPDLEPPRSMPAVKRAADQRMIRLYLAYQRGRERTLRRLQEAAIAEGGRPHQGLWHDLDWARVKTLWGRAAETWEHRFFEANPVRTFDGPLTSQWRIRS